MLTDTFTVRTFFNDLTSNPERALRWGALRHDSGDPFEFIKMAKEAWTTVERQAGIERGEGKGRIGEGKMAVFSDSLDVDKALQIQAMCDEQGMAGETLSSYTAELMRSIIRNRYLPYERFQQEIRSFENL
jgi:nicotinate phosphoribosyltransferase